jgi:hypothetical protein
MSAHAGHLQLYSWHRIFLPLLMGGVVASLLAATLTWLITLSGDRFLPLWAGPNLLVLFYLLSVIAALAVMLFASRRSRLAFGKMPPTTLQLATAKLLTAVVFVYLVLRRLDMIERGLAVCMANTRWDGILILVEIVLLMVAMMWIRATRKTRATCLSVRRWLPLALASFAPGVKHLSVLTQAEPRPR